MPTTNISIDVINDLIERYRETLSLNETVMRFTESRKNLLKNF